MGQFQTADRNGNAYNFDDNAVGGNRAVTTIPADSAGNKALLAPGGTAWQVSSDGQKPTYRAGGVALTLDTTEATVMVEIVGSASKTVRVKKIEVWAQAGTKFYAELTLVRCTAAATGTPIAAAIGKHDTADGPATAVVNYYTDDATLGAGAAVIGAKVLTVAPPAAGMPAIPAVWNFSQNQDKALVLRGVGQVVEVYCNTTGLGTGTYGYEIEWEEDAS